MSTIYFVSFLFLFFSNFRPLLCEPESSDFKKCEAGGVTVTNFTSGVISLPTASNATCSWILDFSAVQGRVEAFLFLETIKFESGDSLVISSLDAKNSSALLLNLNTSLSNNLFFTGTTKNLMINLTTDATSGSSRSFHLFLETKKNSAPIAIYGDTVLKFLNHEGNPDAPRVDYTLKLTLSANQNKKKIAASVDKLSSDISVTFDKPWTDNSPDFLSANNTIDLSLAIKDISSGANMLAISVYSVADACSNYVSLTDKISQTLVEVKPDDLGDSIDIKCLWIIESDDPKNHWLNIGFDPKNPLDVPDGNVFVIRTGNRKSSPVLFILSSSNFNDIRSNVYNSILNSSSLYITYEAFEMHGEHPHFSVFRPVVKNYIDGDTTLNLDPFNMPTKFLLKAKPGNVAVLSAAAAGQTFSNITNVYDQPTLSQNNLLAVFKENDTFPEYLWSDSDILVLDFASLSKKVSIQFKSQPSNLGSTARQSSGSLVLFSDHLDCKSSYNWFIPPRHNALNDDVKIVKSLVISNLALEKGGSMTLTSFAPTMNPHQYTITGENAMSRSLPPFYLDASISHSIKYSRPDGCDKNSMTLIQASIDTISYDACANIVVTAEQDFVSCNYPNYYPLTEWTMSKNCRHMNSSSPNIYIKFIDVDLVSGHSLEFLGSSGTNINLTLSNIPGDKIVSNEVAINFDRVFNNEEKTSKTLNDQLSGRGFKTILEPIECGGMNVNKTGSLSINATDKPQRCIWIIQTPLDKDPKTINLLNFTLSDSLKGAKVYDSDSRKNDRTVNISGAGYYNSTTETIIVEFTTGSTPAQINWSTFVCSDSCLGTRRCINPPERCNGVNDCGDWSDELHCNGTAPVPPEPKIVRSGVSGLVVVFVIMPLSIIFGVVATIMAPRIMARIRGGQYTEFREYSDVS